jgi:hypothetical protein
VWAWLVQLGQDRAGFYSYDWLERAIGADVHNVLDIRTEWQTRQEGDVVPAAQRGYLRTFFPNGAGWTVKYLAPGQALVLEDWGAFVLLPTAEGDTRFIIRSTIGHRNLPVWASALNMMTFQLPHFIMQRRMMLTIKRVAERRHVMRAAIR